MHWIRHLIVIAMVAGSALPLGWVAADTPLVSVNLQFTGTAGQAGVASLTAISVNQTRVVITAAQPDAAYLAAIYRGTCANLDPVVAYPLNDLQHGNSNTVVNDTLTDLTTGGYAISMQSVTGRGGVIACGNIPAQTTAPFVTEPGGYSPAPSSGMPTTGVTKPWVLFLVVGLLLGLAGLRLRRGARV